MDQNTINNWIKVKSALEAAGKIDNQYYKRAVEICAGRPDPLQLNLLNRKKS
jgi:hypothetical protein